MPNKIPDTLLAIAEIGSNRLLSLDEQVLVQCEQLQGRCVELELTDVDLSLFCHPGVWGVRLSQEKPSGDVDAKISGRVMALINLSLQEDKISTSIRERVQIQGDARVAQKMQKILTDLDIDWEEVLSKYTNDVIAYQLHKQFKSTHQWLRDSALSLIHTTNEYLHEEQRIFPTQVEFELFRQQATTLQQDVERCDARLRHLLKSTANKQGV